MPDATVKPWALFESIPEMVVVVDADGRILYANHHCTEIVGWTPRELNGRSVELLVHDQFKEVHRSHRKGYTGDPKGRPLGTGLLLTALHRSGLITAQVTFTALLLALWFYFKGRLYREDEVRPIYASHLAERLSLQAEVSAAREAQIRLLPDKLPEMRHLSVAAVCQPAHEVGGDFYDLFELESGKLGIFMAEGGGRGLPAALTIAFAKGFLMPKIKSEKHTDNSPTEIVRGLQTQLVRTMSQDEVMGFVYAVIDTGDHTLRYAGTGDFPRPQINAHKGVAPAPLDESEINFRLDSEKSFRVTEGLCNLTPGDTVSLLSDGAVKMLSDETQHKSFWARLGTQTDSSYRLRDALADAFHHSTRRKTHLEDDLTAVIVRLKNTGGDE